ncbi:E3 ubiquitin-protein ligase TRAIP [Schistocerca americana]|uniref:E3 ubiquitin-protein ligase TRAIP n=1 Tax=Schistocerca americana TaxID=7009 RepID=UPI001F4F8645|nr:E3 ubiquitin-protein ligase TRAIP [Schistocerca americana]
MHVSCVICSDLFVAADDTFCTQCGHLFHYQCLIQWIERSKSCPQCRTKTTEKNIHRIYFNIPNVDEKYEDPSVLHNKIDGLHFQLRLRDTDLKNSEEKNVKLVNQNVILKEELLQAQQKCKNLERDILTLKEQIKFMRDQTKNAEQAQNDAKQLKRQLEFLKSVEMVVKAAATEVDEMLGNFDGTFDSFKRMSTYVSVLKRELQGSTEKRRNLQTQLKESEKDLNSALNELNRLKKELSNQVEKNALLTDDIKHQEAENRSLQKKIKNLEAAIVSPTASHPSQSALRRFVTESPAPNTLKLSHNIIEKRKSTLAEAQGSTAKEEVPYGELFTCPQSTFGEEKCDDPMENCLQNQEEEPKKKTLKLRFNGEESATDLTPLRGIKFRTIPVCNKFSIFKKPRSEGTADVVGSVNYDSEVTYDGHGGHSKLDEFPKLGPKFRPEKRTMKIPIARMKKKAASSDSLKRYVTGLPDCSS